MAQNSEVGLLALLQGDANILLDLEMPFRPIASYYEAIDALIFLTEDVSYRAKYIRGSAVEILFHPLENRIVGVKISSFSRLVPPEVITAFKKPKMR